MPLSKQRIRADRAPVPADRLRRGLRPDVRAGQGRPARDGHPAGHRGRPRSSTTRSATGSTAGSTPCRRSPSSPTRWPSSAWPPAPGPMPPWPARPQWPSSSWPRPASPSTRRRWSASSRACAPRRAPSSRCARRCWRRQPVTFEYRKVEGEQGTRRVEPWGLAMWHGRWYLTAHDQDRDAERVFRLSRIVGPVTPTGRRRLVRRARRPRATGVRRVLGAAAAAAAAGHPARA